jgi:predicted Zn-dependent protease with MMP-like domain
MSAFADLPPPSLDDFEQLARTAWESLPSPFRAAAGEVLFRVEDFATDQVLDDLGIDDPLELTGLYAGADLAHRSVLDPAPAASMIFLYRLPILFEWAERGEATLRELITHVLVHEVGHHFGMTDGQIDAILESED